MLRECFYSVTINGIVSWDLPSSILGVAVERSLGVIIIMIEVCLFQ